MKYRLVFNGELTGNVPKSECLAQLSELFGKDSSVIETELFRGKPIVVKNTTDAQVASRFMAAFEKAGAVLRVEAPDLAASKSSLKPDPEIQASVELRDAQATKLRPRMHRDSPKLSDQEETVRRTVSSFKDDSDNDQSGHR